MFVVFVVVVVVVVVVVGVLVLGVRRLATCPRGIESTCTFIHS